MSKEKKRKKLRRRCMRLEVQLQALELELERIIDKEKKAGIPVGFIKRSSL